MGLGTPPQVLKMIALGVDMFDCVLPTRVRPQRPGVHPRRADEPAERTVSAPTRGRSSKGSTTTPAGHFSRAYLRHLSLANEMLAGTLLTIHNLHFYLDLMAQARAHIEAGDFGAVASRLDRAVRGTMAA